MKVTGLPSLPDNCSLHFHANGVKIRVSLNVEKELVKYIPANKVSKRETYFVYWCSKEIPLQYCSPKNITDIYQYLLQNVMINVRRFKQLMLEEQIYSIKNKPKY